MQGLTRAPIFIMKTRNTTTIQKTGSAGLRNCWKWTLSTCWTSTTDFFMTVRDGRYGRYRKEHGFDTISVRKAVWRERRSSETVGKRKSEGNKGDVGEDIGLKNWMF